METADLEYRVGGPCGRELKLIAQQNAVVMRRGGEPRGRQRALVHQIVFASVEIERDAQEPVGTLRLRNVQASRRDNVMKGRADRTRYGDGGHTRNLSGS